VYNYRYNCESDHNIVKQRQKPTSSETVQVVQATHTHTKKKKKKSTATRRNQLTKSVIYPAIIIVYYRLLRRSSSINTVKIYTKQYTVHNIYIRRKRTQLDRKLVITSKITLQYYHQHTSGAILFLHTTTTTATSAYYYYYYLLSIINLLPTLTFRNHPFPIPFYPSFNPLMGHKECCRAVSSLSGAGGKRHSLQ